MKLEVKNLKYQIDSKEILKGVSFTVIEPEIVSIIGPNGAGKTTLLKCLNRVSENFSGEIILNDVNIKDFSRKEISEKIGLMQQEFNSLYDYTVSEIIEMGRYISNISPKKFEQTATYLNIHNLLKSNINEISTGEKQLVQIGMILYQDPQIFLLDEPVSHLDPYYSKIIIRTIQDLKARAKTILSIFHNINIALNISDRVLVLNSGELKFIGTPAELLKTSIIETTFHTKPQIFQEKKRFYIDFF